MVGADSGPGPGGKPIFDFNFGLKRELGKVYPCLLRWPADLAGTIKDSRWVIPGS